MKTETAHRLPDHNGKCANIHGHSYHWKVGVQSNVLQTEGSPNGMVFDFKLLKNAMEETIGLFDHALVLAENDPWEEVFREQARRGRGTEMIVMPFTPTAENMARWVFEHMQQHIESAYTDWRVAYVEIWETATSMVRYDGDGMYSEGGCCGEA